MKIAAALLAAGSSSRLGHPKQLAAFRGQTLVRSLASELCQSQCSPVAVVTGAQADRVGAELAGLPCEAVFNPEWEEGMASSLRTAASWALSQRADGLLVAVVDQVFLDQAHLGELLRVFRERQRLCASRYGVVGVPAIFGRGYLPALLKLRGAEGARKVLREQPDVPYVDWPPGKFDLDTPEDEALLAPAMAQRPIASISIE